MVAPLAVQAVPDLRAGRHAAQGKSIVALPSTGRWRLRIVPVLDGSRSRRFRRTDVDFIVTDQRRGFARTVCVQERAEAITRLPSCCRGSRRRSFERAWRKLRDGL